MTPVRRKTYKNENPTYAGEVDLRLREYNITPVYLYYGTTAHLVDTVVTNTTNGHVLCGRQPVWPMTWMGTGTQDEIDHAGQLPLCRSCLDRLDRMEKARKASTETT